jgi:hypothetical protein
MTNQPPSPWQPDPGRADELTQTVTFDKYQMSLPKGYAADPPKSAGSMKVFSWKGPAPADLPPPVLIATVTADKKLVEEAKKNMRQTLVNYSAGTTTSSGIKIAKRGPTETGSLAGIEFSRFTWSGTTAAGVAVSGLAYGGIDEPNAVILLAINFGPNTAGADRLSEAAIATLRRQ